MKVLKIEPRDNDMDRKAMDMPKVSSMVLVVLDTDNRLRELATIRWHKSPRGSRVRCNLWVHSTMAAIMLRQSAIGSETRGSGMAGGYGYCKRSAAASDAFRHAGIDFDEYMHGAGIGRVREALEAIARQFGYSVFHVVEE